MGSHEPSTQRSSAAPPELNPRASASPVGQSADTWGALWLQASPRSPCVRRGGRSRCSQPRSTSQVAGGCGGAVCVTDMRKLANPEAEGSRPCSQVALPVPELLVLPAALSRTAAGPPPPARPETGGGGQGGPHLPKHPLPGGAQAWAGQGSEGGLSTSPALGHHVKLPGREQPQPVCRTEGTAVRTLCERVCVLVYAGVHTGPAVLWPMGSTHHQERSAGGPDLGPPDRAGRDTH